jgi:IS4 transposase
MSNRKQQASVGIAVAFRSKRTRSGRRRRVGKPLVFAFWGFKPASPAWVRQTYRSRYGIETSYRQMNQARPRTCTRDPRLRLLLVALALILRNLWVWVHRQVLSRMRGRSRELRLNLLRFRTMLLMLLRCAEAVLGCAESPPNLLSIPQLAMSAGP